MKKSSFLCVSVPLWWVFLELTLHLPQDLPRESEQDLRVVGLEAEAANQAAQFLFARCRRCFGKEAAFCRGFGKGLREAFEFGRTR